MKLLCKVIVCTILAVVIKETASLTCEEECKAKPGTCVYPSTKSPLPTEETPQFITITFDDPMTYPFETYVNEIFEDRYNPDNSSILGTLYFPHRNTDYQVAKRLCNKGHEIGLNIGINDGFQEYMTPDKLRQMVKAKGAIKVGFGVNRDSPCVVKNSIKLFPYTLDCSTNQNCSKGPLGTKSDPGQWIMPIADITRKDGSSCNTLADCGTENYTASAIFDLLKKHFNSFYLDNRAPMTFTMSTKWFQTSPNSLKGLKLFVHYLKDFDDVYLVPHREVINWMRKPTALPYTTDFVANACGSCNDAHTCEYTVNSESIVMNICGICPKVYPGATIVKDVQL